MIQLSTFLDHPDQIPILEHYSLHSLIIDSSICSIRSFRNYDWSLAGLKMAKKKCKAKFFTLNLDGFYSDSELAIIKSNFSKPFISLFDAIRIQDPGLISWIRSIHPSASIQLNSETGNHHRYAIQTLFDLGINQITLNHEIPYQTIQSFVAEFKNIEIFVQGNILIQYSRRQFYSDYYQTDSNTPISYLGEDDDLPNRKFTFLNTHFGHFMFAHFQRCLAEYSQQLLPLSNSPWLIDCRGENNHYLSVCLSLYSSLNKLTHSNIKQTVKELSTLSNKSQKPSFFLSNNTDYDWRDYANNFDKNKCIGSIVSVSKLDSICIQLFTEINSDATIICNNPDQTWSEIPMKKIILNNNESLIRPLSLLYIPWQKGIQTKGRLYIKDS